jgi:probable F420-dependent oxidoreductase
MRFGVALPQFGPHARGPAVRDRIRDVALAADRLGFDVVWTAEHLIFPSAIRTPYPYGGGRAPFEVTDPILDVTATLAFVAASTTRVHLGSSVIVLPYHHPIALAKALASLDVLSQGRVLFGVAGGWLREEFDLLGVPFHQRGARTDEYLALIKLLWTEERVSFHGRFFSLDDAVFYPKPVQRPHPPIWIGGHSAAALQRVGRLGDGWLAVPRDLDQLDAGVQTIRRHAEAAGRDPAAVGVATSGAARSLDELLDRLPRLEQLGVTIVNLPALFWTRSVEAAIELMETFAQRAMLGARDS